MVTFDVVIPFWNTHPDRLRNLRFTISWYRRHLPAGRVVVVEHATRTPDVDADLHLVVTDVDPDLFNKSQLVNEAYSRTAGSHLVVADADCLPEPGVLAGLERTAARKQGLFVVLHSIVAYLTPDASRTVIAGGTPDVGGCRSAVTVGGAVMCSADVYWRLGGHDQRRYLGWGGEDDDLYNRAYVQGMSGGRLQSRLLHLDHPAARRHLFTPEVMVEKRARVPVCVLPRRGG